jgi:hypothetical protein
MAAAKIALNSENIEFIMISDQDLPIISQFSGDRGKNYPFKWFKMTKKLSDIGIYSIPVNILLNPEGKIVLSERSSQHWNSVIKITQLQKIMATK